jgi:uncharacterized membrane protein YsdA (DUF1294 family)
VIAAYLAGINLAAFAAMGLDKRFAMGGGWRISERTLLALAAVGGSVGAIAGQQAFRHKTRKEPFRTLLWLTPAWQAAAVAGWLALAPQ